MTYTEAIACIGNGVRPIRAAQQLFGTRKWTWAVMLRNYAWNMVVFKKYPNAIVPVGTGIGSYNDIAMAVYSRMPKEVQAIARGLHY